MHHTCLKTDFYKKVVYPGIPMAPNMSDKGRSPISAERWICFSASVTKVCVLHPARIRTMDPTGYCLFLLTITLPIEFILQLYIYTYNIHHFIVRATTVTSKFYNLVAVVTLLGYCRYCVKPQNDQSINFNLWLFLF